MVTKRLTRRAQRALERQLSYQKAKAEAMPVDLVPLERDLTAYAHWVKARVEKHRLIAPDARVLEVGSGAHGVVFFLGMPHAVGVDPLAADYARLFPQWQSRVKTLTAFGESLPFDDAAFDLVITDNVVDHAADPAQIVRELARVLAPGGVLYFTVNVHHRFYDVMSRAHGILQALRVPLEIAPFADHTVHLTVAGARRLFRRVPLRLLQEDVDIESVRDAARRSDARRAGDMLKRVFFKNARLEIIATRD
jgi:SAM-dependent methyltransferase